MKIQRLILYFLIITAFLISWCRKQETNNLQVRMDAPDKLSCVKYYKIWIWQIWNLELKAKVVASNIKNIVSPVAWIVSKLNCENGQLVKKDSLVAIIIPDRSDPNVKNLVQQKQFLQNQITNLQSIISSTKASYQQQLRSLNIQKNNLEAQIRILEENINKLKHQKKYGVRDLEQQLKTLEDQLQHLLNSKNSLLQSRQSELNKIKLSIKDIRISAKSLIKNILLRVDEVFGITDKNKHKNDAFEAYLSAKNTALKEKIKWMFIKLNSRFQNIDNFSDTQFLKYIKDIHELVFLVKDAIKASVSAPTFPQSMIDWFYNEFLNYDNSLISVKSQLDSLLKTYETVQSQYSGQLINLENQITTIKNNIQNLKENKVNSYISSIDVQINQLQAQLENYKNNLQVIETNIKNLENQEDIQIRNLSNQLIQLQNSIASINTSLSIQRLYAGVDWKVKSKNTAVWNKVWPNTLLCQIIPNKFSLRLQVIGNLWNLKKERNSYGYVEFKVGDKICKSNIVSKLPYKDPVTQNDIYETESIAYCKELSEDEVRRWSEDKLSSENLPNQSSDNSLLIKVDLSDILSEWQILSVKYISSNWVYNLHDSKVKIPINFVINKLTGQYVKIKDKDWKIKLRKVILWEVDWNIVAVNSWLKLGDVICY